MWRAGPVVPVRLSNEALRGSLVRLAVARTERFGIAPVALLALLACSEPAGSGSAASPDSGAGAERGVDAGALGAAGSQGPRGGAGGGGSSGGGGSGAAMGASGSGGGAANGGSTPRGGAGGTPATDAGGMDGGQASTADEPGASVFDRDRLHLVSITVAPADIGRLDEHTETRVPATVVFDGVTLTQVGVRNKGQTSFQPVSGKPGFSVKFDEFVAGQKLDGLRKLLLNNTVQDPTWCNETLTYETYRRAGLPAPRVAFAVVTLNDQPKGIYSVGEAVNAQFLARHYGKDMDQGNLYEGPWDFSDPIEKADLKDEVEENRTRDDLRALTAVVLSEPDDGFPARLATVLDVDQFLLGYAIDAVTVGWDGYAYDAWNYYMYDHPKDHRFVFLPAGANWPYFRDAADAAPTVDPRVLRSLWGGGKDPASFLAGARVQRVPALDARFDAAVRDVTHGAFDVAALHADFDRVRATLHSRAPTDDATRRDLATFDERVHLAYEFVEKRKAYLLAQFP